MFVSNARNTRKAGTVGNRINNKKHKQERFRQMVRRPDCKSGIQCFQFLNSV